MRQKRPNASGETLDPQPPDVPLQESARETTASSASRPRRREGPARLAETPPRIHKRSWCSRPTSGQREPAHLDEEHASGQRLGHPLDEVQRGAAEQQENGAAARIVANRPEQLEQRRLPLHLVNHDQALAVPKHSLRSGGQRFASGGNLQIENRGWIGPGRGHLPAPASSCRPAELPSRVTTGASESPVVRGGKQIRTGY